MNIGTKSVLFGAHQFLIHPWFVAAGWFKLHGFKRVFVGEVDVAEYLVEHSGTRWPVTVRRDRYTSILDPRLWAAFFLHDIGYLGKPNMDGEEGEEHPYAGAFVMGKLFGVEWYHFTLYHSRFLAKRNGAKPSALCMADKLAIVLTPSWLYLPLVRATGEVYEYMAKSAVMNNTGDKYLGARPSWTMQRQWRRDVCTHVRAYVAAHKDGQDDTWTPNRGAA